MTTVSVWKEYTQPSLFLVNHPLYSWAFKDKASGSSQKSPFLIVDLCLHANYLIFP